MKTLIIATKNKGKIAEFNDMLQDRWNVKSLLDYDIADIPKTESHLKKMLQQKQKRSLRCLDAWQWRTTRVLKWTPSIRSLGCILPGMPALKKTMKRI